MGICGAARCAGAWKEKEAPSVAGMCGGGGFAFIPWEAEKWREMVLEDASRRLRSDSLDAIGQRA